MNVLKGRELIILGLFEVLALILIVRIWVKPRFKRIIPRLLWSIVLLVPFFGLMLYLFATNDPSEHPYDTDTMQDAAESYYENSEGDHH